MSTGPAVELDEDDLKILGVLQGEGDISFSRLGRTVSIPTSTVHDKVMRLISEGVIKKFTIIVDEKALGFNVVVLLGVETDAKFYKKVAEKLVDMVEVVEVYGTTAEFDLMIKVQATNRDELTKILDKIRAIDGIDDIYIFSVLEVFKDQHMRPIKLE
jgi:Lrp/AsnC family transcriptional regulator for asnA, asnC and gidA